MKTSQIVTDRVAIGLSLTCALHCMLLPSLLLLLPSIAALSLNTEAFHITLVIAVIPSSLFALKAGYQQHGNSWVIFGVSIGLILLVLALLLGTGILGEQGELILTVIGSICIAFGHSANYQLSKKGMHENCCPDKISTSQLHSE
ncbi:MerC domain-containing protein [Algicola sagamiensis]|uniref:MerC domain-containing protein n=1 Tax=Algicola sagamiensis TaxID=163869 RepID=UPI0003769F5C|nr:MerC domain-containing protein [Algicola sagamiensis]